MSTQHRSHADASEQAFTFADCPDLHLADVADWLKSYSAACPYDMDAVAETVARHQQRRWESSCSMVDLSVLRRSAHTGLMIAARFARRLADRIQ
ncbi:hypothetical protein WH50_15410 [Pokkaliibacter plantistimulans]|uniref:Uncharacterized protein n=1 Tax=Pokkaliibacter plantistimulans TaxID=1635171 RepID=A0ABX5M0K0_9GAMM|nr:hypothetical protein [Pokkaliibacter plantistimulans]PXF30450.1 hypothetical protein WH50_15410 [Pokkaliibacter plantistimulans]